MSGEGIVRGMLITPLLVACVQFDAKCEPHQNAPLTSVGVAVNPPPASNPPPGWLSVTCATGIAEQ